MTGLALYAVDALGGTLAISALPGAGGAYDADLDLLRDWGAAVVLSLTQGDEMAKPGAARLGSDLQALGCRWLHFPIPDFGVPSQHLMTSWPAISSDLRDTLSGGGRVLVHCRGGCGRSGMVALRLMVEAGESPDKALKRLRSVRPCAVETAAQMRWARAK